MPIGSATLSRIPLHRSDYHQLGVHDIGSGTLGSYGISAEDMADFWKDKSYALSDILGDRLDAEQLGENPTRQEVWGHPALPNERADNIVRGWNGA